MINTETLEKLHRESRATKTKPLMQTAAFKKIESTLGDLIPPVVIIAGVGNFVFRHRRTSARSIQGD
jgi:hypothetical protein